MDVICEPFTKLSSFITKRLFHFRESDGPELSLMDNEFRVMNFGPWITRTFIYIKFNIMLRPFFVFIYHLRYEHMTYDILFIFFWWGMMFLFNFASFDFWFWVNWIVLFSNFIQASVYPSFKWQTDKKWNVLRKFVILSFEIRRGSIQKCTMYYNKTLILKGKF